MIIIDDTQLHQQRAFGQRLRQIRRARGLTQRVLSTKVGVSHATVAHWEIGDMSIGDASLRKLATFLGVSKPWLRNGKEPMVPEMDTTLDWPSSALRDSWGVSIESLPKEWPTPFRVFIVSAASFGLAPSTLGFSRLLESSRNLGTDSPLAPELELAEQSALTLPLTHRRRLLVEHILEASNTELDSMEDAWRKIK